MRRSAKSDAMALDANSPVEFDIARPNLALTFLVALCFWFSIIAVSSLSAVVRGYEYRWINVPLDASLVVYAAAVSTAVHLGLRRLTRFKFWKQAIIAVLLISVLVFPFEAGFTVIRTFVGPDAAKYTGQNIFTFKGMLNGVLFWLAPWSLWFAASLALLHNAESRDRAYMLSIAQREAHEAQIRALRYQVNPHFLHNTLSSISTLILDGQSMAAERMVVQLSHFFRASLAHDPRQDVKLRDELELQRLYLQIEQMRFTNNLRVEYHVPEELQDAVVPSLILQPLVENAVKHGMKGGGLTTTIKVSASAASGRLMLEVQDDGAGPAKAGGTGVGLQNVRRRLEARYGRDCRFEASPGPTGGFTARLEVPLSDGR